MKPITIKDIKLHTIALPFVEPLKTSFGNDPVKATVIAEVITQEGVSGWGEITVEVAPGYAAETPVTSAHIAKNFLIPKLVGKTINHPQEAQALMKKVRGHHHTKFGLETGVWDALAKVNDMRLVDLFSSYLPEGHTTKGYASVGVSIGIQKSVEDTIKIIQKRYDQGYRRIKLKIQPGWDVELARGVRAALPDIVMMLDANSAYTLKDAEHLKQLDQYNLLMIEQPLADDDIYEHSKLRPMLKTPICLDESIKSPSDLKLAIELGAISILNLKPVRVGGYSDSLEIYKICVENKLPLWIGGMMETGVGRAANVAFASLPGVNMPSDISATDRYYNPDVTEPPFVLGPNSTLAVPEAAGIGIDVQPDRLEQGKKLWREVNTYVD